MDRQPLVIWYMPLPERIYMRCGRDGSEILPLILFRGNSKGKRGRRDDCPLYTR